MAYTYITDLPPQVRSILTPELQQTWLNTFNGLLAATSNETEAYQTAWIKTFEAAFPGEIIPSMAAKEDESMGYWVDLTSIQFTDINGQDSSWIQAMPLGEYAHPRHGKIALTPDRIKEFANNVAGNVRQIELDIDYDHKEKRTDAAGWVKQADVRLTDPDPKKNGLWLLVEWTKEAAQKIKNKEFKYFSPEFVDSWKDPKTNKVHKNVLFGGGITNRPFLKDILPINLSDLMPIPTGGFMDPKELAKLLGLSEDATADQIKAKMAELAKPEPPKTTPEEDAAAIAKAEADRLKAETDAQLVAASESAATKALSDRVIQLEAALRLSEVTSAIDKVATSGKFAIAPVLLSEAKDLALGLSKPDGDKLIGFIQKLTEAGAIELGERGGSDAQRITASDDPVKAFMEAIDAKMKVNTTMSFSDASVAVGSEQPQLYNEYREAVYIREGVK